jgi:hypothetical protein
MYIKKTGLKAQINVADLNLLQQFGCGKFPHEMTLIKPKKTSSHAVLRGSHGLEVHFEAPHGLNLIGRVIIQR